MARAVSARLSPWSSGNTTACAWRSYSTVCAVSITSRALNSASWSPLAGRDITFSIRVDEDYYFIYEVEMESGVVTEKIRGPKLAPPSKPLPGVHAAEHVAHIACTVPQQNAGRQACATSRTPGCNGAPDPAPGRRAQRYCRRKPTRRHAPAARSPGRPAAAAWHALRRTAAPML